MKWDDTTEAVIQAATIAAAIEAVTEAVRTAEAEVHAAEAAIIAAAEALQLRLLRGIKRISSIRKNLLTLRENMRPFGTMTKPAAFHIHIQNIPTSRIQWIPISEKKNLLLFIIFLCQWQ